MSAPFSFGFAGTQTVRHSEDRTSLDTNSEFLRIRVRAIGPRPIIQFHVQGVANPLFTEANMRHENGIFQIIFPPNPGFQILHNRRYALSVSFAGGVQTYDVLIEKMNLPSASPSLVVQVIRDTTIASGDARDFFAETFRIL